MAGVFSEIVVFGSLPMKKDVQVRMRERIRARLQETGMTARELARAVGHDDAWISGILAGAQGLHWKDFDAVANKLGLAPSELVRHDDDEVRELTPTEMRLLKHYQSWPKVIQTRWVELLDFYAERTPDAEFADFIAQLKMVPKSLRRPVLEWLAGLLEAGTPPIGSVDGGGHESTAAPSGTDTKRRNRLGRTQLAWRGRTEKQP